MSSIDNFCVYLDAGHGGIDRFGNYVTAPDKMWDHGDDVPTPLHDKGKFYEGVFNRDLCDAIKAELKAVGVDYMPLYEQVDDTPLRDRTDLANWLHTNYKPGILISNHADAFPPNLSVHGFGAFIYSTLSPALGMAKNLYKRMNEEFTNEVKLREITVKNLHMTRESIMPAILIENGFFTNYNQATWLLKEDTIMRLAKVQRMMVMDYINENLNIHV